MSYSMNEQQCRNEDNFLFCCFKRNINHENEQLFCVCVCGLWKPMCLINFKKCSILHRKIKKNQTTIKIKNTEKKKFTKQH